MPSLSLGCNAVSSKGQRHFSEWFLIMSNVPCKTTLRLSSLITEATLMLLLSVCACVFARQGLTAAHLASQWTMELQLRLGSAPMSLHSQVSWCVTLFPVTFSAINLQPYCDGVPLWGYIVRMSHHFLHGAEVGQLCGTDVRMKLSFDLVICYRKLRSFIFFHDINMIKWMNRLFWLLIVTF